MTTYAEVDGQYIDRDGYAVDRDGSLVYFVQEMGGAERIKIGITTSMRHRIRQLQTGSPESLAIIHTEPGGAKREQYFHRRWARYRYRRNGEWFNPAPSILAYVASAPAGRRGPLAPSISAVPWGKVGRTLGVVPRGAWRLIIGLLAYLLTRKKKYLRTAGIGGAAGAAAAGAYFVLDPAIAVPVMTLSVLGACLLEGSR